MIYYVYCIDIIACLTFRMYQDKLASLKKQLQQLKDGTHPEYNAKLKKIDQALKERYSSTYKLKEGGL